MDFELSQLHFIRPVCLLLLPIIIGIWLLLRKSAGRSSWEDHIPKAVVEALQVNLASGSRGWQWCLLASYLTLAIAAAGPSWSKQAAPALQNQSAMVLVLDLSPSMLAKDLTPDRLTLAKYKLIDILRKQADTQVALVAYAGDAHTVSPLTDDPRTIEALLPALHPYIMPSRGSNVEAGIQLAKRLLRDASASSGDIILISDGLASDAIDALKGQWNDQHRLSILAVGGEQGAPIPERGGGFMRNSQGEIVLAGVDYSSMSTLARQLAGRFATLSADDSDLEKLLVDRFESAESGSLLEIDNRFDTWVDMGHLLLIIALPLLLVCFRRGLVYCLPLIFLLPGEKPALAQTDINAGESPSVVTNADAVEPQFKFWDSLWNTADQQAAKLYEQQKFNDAAKKFKRKDWSAIASYQAGDYEQSINNFDTQSIRDLYNKGNALALNGELEDAIKTFDQVLEQDQLHEDAAHNKKVVEQLLQQQQEQQQQGQDQQDSQDQPDDQQESEQQKQESSDNSESSGSDKDSQNEQQGQEPQPGEEPQPDEEPQPGEEPESSEEQEPQPGEDQESEKDQQSESAQQENEQESENEEQAQNINTQQSAEQAEGQLKDTSEQWLRSIADDPSGLLRRKFEYQSKQRRQQGQTVNNNQERF